MIWKARIERDGDDYLLVFPERTADALGFKAAIQSICP